MPTLRAPRLLALKLLPEQFNAFLGKAGIGGTGLCPTSRRSSAGSSINDNITPGIVRVHHLRAIRSGRFTHVDAHLVVPEFWTVEEAHDVGDAFEQRVFNALPLDGEIVFHVDPCHRSFCSLCDVEPCPIRMAAFERNPTGRGGAPGPTGKSSNEDWGRHGAHAAVSYIRRPPAATSTSPVT